MTTDDFVAELYRDHDWRFGEVRRLKNLVSDGKDEADRELLRRSLVVILYAHFEGFCVFSLQHYVAAVNQAKIDCKRAASAILAGAWDPLFRAMETGDRKCKVFQKKLPNDRRLHRHWRRRHLVEELDRLRTLPVLLDDDAIDAESNLKPEVLQRNLFILGLDHTFVESHATTINNLLARRNRIAHGIERRGVPELEYERYEYAVFEICFLLVDFLESSHRNSSYVK